jgi:hypothetical protein
MKRWIYIFSISMVLQFIHLNASAQQLVNVYLNQKGKASYRVAIDNIYVVISDSGKLTEIKTDAYGTIVYNSDKRVNQIGNIRIGFNYQGFVNLIGNTQIRYDYNGRTDRLGNLELRYNYNGLLVTIGGQQIVYNTDNSIDQIGLHRITYNYNKQVQKIDDSKGLIVLQLNYDK